MSERLKRYIKKRLEEGFNEEEIRQKLKKTRYTDEEIEGAFSEINTEEEAVEEEVEEEKEEVPRESPEIGEPDRTDETETPGIRETFSQNKLLVSVLTVLIVGILVLNVYLAVFYTPFEEEPEEVAPPVEPSEEDAGEPELLFRENIQDHFDQPIYRIPALTYSEQKGKLYGGTSFGESNMESFHSEGIVFEFDPESKEVTDVIDVLGRPQALDVENSVLVSGGLSEGESLSGHFAAYDLESGKILTEEEIDHWVYDAMIVDDNKLVYSEVISALESNIKFYDLEEDEVIFEDKAGPTFVQDDNYVYVFSRVSMEEPFKQIITSIDKRGAEIDWSRETEFVLPEAPTVDLLENKLLIGRGNGLMGYDLETGEEEEIFFREGYNIPEGGMGTGSGTIYSASGNKTHITAYDLESDEFLWQKEEQVEINNVFAGEDLYLTGEEYIIAYRL